MSPPRFRSRDFEINYLIQLTRHGLKPLSRWEGPLNEEARRAIRSEGLALETVTRRTRIGRRVPETVFAKRARYTSIYRKHFHNTRLKDTPSATRSQGRLFGYPSCCVEAFIHDPYTPNELSPEDQEILFHWACPSCKVTPGILREYRRIFNECARRHGSPAASRGHSTSGFAKTLASVAASLALLAGTTAWPAMAQDPHWLPAPDDLDQDYLSFAEEILAGTDWEEPDTDQDQVLDGVQMSLLLNQLINSPPIGVELEHHLLKGLEECNVCGEEVNMGHVTIKHLYRGLSVDLPYIALHYLEHGCLAYDGFFHAGRVNLAEVKKILMPCIWDTSHLLAPWGEDPDNDYLVSEEEPPLGMDPADADTDNDLVKDGPQVAEDLLPMIAQLPRMKISNGPYMLELWMDGVEQCEVCGITFNMGVAEIVNPLEGLSVTAPFVGLHTLAHGGFAYDGTHNDGYILPLALRAVLTGDGTSHWIPVASDTDGDGMTDDEEPFFGLDPAVQDENGNGIPDGREMAKTMASQIRALPNSPSLDFCYAIEHLTFGFYMCTICGEQINMGYLEIVNPKKGRTIDVPLYNLHFMEHGSYETDRDAIYPRIDPRQVAAVIWGDDITGVHTPPMPLSLMSAPNPFCMGSTAEITLSMPAEGPLAAAIYDVAGRKVRDLFHGNAPNRIMRFRWDGHDNEGRAASAGVYFCRVKIGSVTLARKITLVH